MAKNLLLDTYTTGVHFEGFNRVERMWSANAANEFYPYVGKSTVNRGADVGESNTPAPTGVRDLQLHPPNNLHLTVAAFRVAESGNYSVSELAVRRVDGTAGQTVRLRLFNAQGVELANLQASSNRAWVRSTSTFSLGNLVAGNYIYFAVDGDGGFGWDATEIAWQVQAVNTTLPPLPTCALTVTPSSVVQGTARRCRGRRRMRPRCRSIRASVQRRRWPVAREA